MLFFKNKTCPNCKKKYKSNEDYCPHCGTPAKESEYIPERGISVLYGPLFPTEEIHPVENKHKLKCTKCGHSWESDEMEAQKTVCPKCGGDARMVKDKK